VASQWELTWREGSEPTCIDAAELDAVLLSILDERHDGLPLLIVLATPNGRSMGIGLDEPSVATFTYTLDPPYFVSRGTVSTGGTPLVFSYAGHWSEYDPEAAIPLADALDGLRAFCASDEYCLEGGLRMAPAFVDPQESEVAPGLRDAGGELR
jgi:hypothetical protein